jgi:hypothetical protein
VAPVEEGTEPVVEIDEASPDVTSENISPEKETPTILPDTVAPNIDTEVEPTAPADDQPITVEQDVTDFPNFNDFDINQIVEDRELFILNHAAIGSQMELILDVIREKVGKANSENLATAFEDFQCVGNLESVLPGDKQHHN